MCVRVCVHVCVCVCSFFFFFLLCSAVFAFEGIACRPRFPPSTVKLKQVRIANNTKAERLRWRRGAAAAMAAVNAFGGVVADLFIFFFCSVER